LIVSRDEEEDKETMPIIARLFRKYVAEFHAKRG
jgi:hypothetical protein